VRAPEFVHWAKGKAAEWSPAFACGLVAAVLLLPNLGDRCLWQDEAQTALISKTVLTHGMPKGSDGRNSFSQESGRDIGPGGLWRWHPWFPFYWQAAFFAGLGAGTWSARVSFAVFGIATVVLVQRFGTRLFGSSRAGVLAAIILAINVPFLLLMRQGRYFGPDAFFAVLGMSAYWSAVVGPPATILRRSWLLLVLALLFLFHTQFLHCAALMTAMVSHAFLFYRHHVRSLVAACVVVVVLVAPWVWWFAGAHAGGAEQGRELWSKILQCGEMTGLLGQWVLSPAVILAAAPLIIAKSRREELLRDVHRCGPALMLPALTIGILIIACGLTAPFAWVRYMTPMIAPCCLLMGWVVDRGMYWHPAIGPVTIAVAAGLSPMRDYVYEITHRFHGPVEAIVDRINGLAQPDDLVVISYDDMAVKFYTPLRVLGGLTGESLVPAVNAEWIVVRAFKVCSADESCREFLNQHVDPAGYEHHRTACGDPWIDNIEDPRFHRYRMTGAEPPLYIHRRIQSR
jgi:4-amino-4-deoxy-L-arabinose transferase-like glycosyltransferase